jgi:hypothetical protein
MTPKNKPKEVTVEGIVEELHMKLVPFIDHPEEFQRVLRENITAYAEAIREEMNNCTCKEKWTFGVVHRKDTPCYWPERTPTTNTKK